jgi:hypothetical protein
VEALVAEVDALAVDGSGNPHVLGSFNDWILLDPSSGSTLADGYTDAFLLKLDASNGSHLWDRTYGGEGAELTPMAMAISSTGHIVIGGGFIGTVDFGGVELTNVGSRDIFVARLDANANMVWRKQFGESGWANVHALSILPGDAQELHLGAAFNGTLNLGGGDMDEPDGTDVVMARLDSVGEHVWSQSFGDSAAQGARALANDSVGNAVLAGVFRGTLDFGGSPLEAHAGEETDIFVAKFAP